ncbi:TRAP-type mannitol/chloroaromatic compound transport system permease large subunit [Curtobacterium flaccumfaciens]|uniref:TRAP-type mannitol/chloroaromatic compound transport system permease large subunit n=1 Tax=Curtobacterium salicis TaxID=1779862 RepID=A0ABX0TC59_9MICO|nr:transporter [Curtobacterium sp. WW7]NII42569.1 TRAP-type mannitol/chloroaromatic compound transport system permease large subunit [Curtobacterium sp. WW7]
MGIAIIIVMAIGVALILTGKVPTAFALVLLAVAIALVSGAPFVGAENSVLSTVLQDGAIRLASTMIAILLGSWLGSLMRDTAIASTLVRKTVEFGGDRPVVVALGVLLISALCGAVTGSAPAALLAGVIGIPAMIAVGVPKVTAAGTILMGIGAGVPFELPVWQFFSTALDLPVADVRSFMVLLFPFAAVAAVAYVLVETRRRGTVHQWSLASMSDADADAGSSAPAADTRSRRQRLGDAPWFALLTPLVPIVLALVLQVPIIPSLLAGVLFAVTTTTPPRLIATRMLRSLYDAFHVAAPPIALFIAIGMLLAAVGLPGAVAALRPIVEAVAPTNVVLYVVVFSVLVPLCLYRGPLNIFGLGAGIAGAMTAIGFYSPMAVLGLMTSYNQVFGVADPTSTQTVWAAQYSGVTPQQVMVRVLPYVWVVAIAGIVLSAVRYL